VAAAGRPAACGGSGGPTSRSSGELISDKSSPYLVTPSVKTFLRFDVSTVLLPLLAFRLSNGKLYPNAPTSI
uniref:Uncharacterized protein n=1 Tax=Canis lupus dingo TaxID=286419 RepID=A0A8C0JYC1_CANLU